MKKMKKHVSFLTATACAMSLFLTPTANAFADSNTLNYAEKGNVSKNKFKKNKRFESTVTTTKDKQIKLVFENNKIYYTNYIYEAPWDYKIVKKLTIKLKGNKKINIKNGKFYLKDKLYTGSIRTEDTLVIPLQGKSYFYLKGKVKKGILVSGTEYRTDYDAVWAG